MRAQEAKPQTKTDYPEGFYYTFDDFVNKNVRPPIYVHQYSIRKPHEMPNDSIVDQVFFYGARSREKITDVCAISWRGNLYIQQRQMTKHAAKGDRDQEGANSNSYHRVIVAGKFLYMEGIFGSALTRGVLGQYGLVGSALGTGAVTAGTFKGVAYDPKQQRFDFFSSCKDFNKFIIQYGGQTIDCGNDKAFTLEAVRNAVENASK